MRKDKKEYLTVSGNIVIRDEILWLCIDGFKCELPFELKDFKNNSITPFRVIQGKQKNP